MSDSEASSPSTYLDDTPSSTNFVEDVLVTSADERDSALPLVPWRSGADNLDLLRRNTYYAYVGHNNWLAARQAQQRPLRLRRKVIVRRQTYTIVDEVGISRDFFLIIALCFSLAVLMIIFLRPIALELLWYYID
ncbi:hypothetical protein MIND_01073200 [Mycena indigotica]|uniref:Uncharacterized protein n=1 Tax=Mycena indigotica TaxID=2126181 RepID=A0A8H6VYW4_9AGAR|nr:uncharacterized protein MIND_01073200 [Mycena indigotica]KAF7295338.1 hypothetical protein MIND_01073200 [Mycena indigotica]